ncbi:Uncharacterised protein [Serratia fonticola]|uniref:Uncharacterized protein n=1 Tax=Serratia fonticola TaxID=47917 RepID=A0A4U9UGA5_SERFO|nr:Uncharacterised protein [Serratia fonticola]
MDLPAPFGPMMPTDGTLRYREGEIFDQQAVAVGFTQIVNFNHFIAKRVPGG